MDDDRVTLNAGGRIFETTALTLKTSGAGYFEALLGETGSKLPGTKRARVSEDGADAPGHREIFIDRDPDVFADVLRFMRTSRLPAAAAADAHRLADLKTESQFLAYDALLNACDAAEAALAAAAALAAPVPCEEKAELKMFCVEGADEDDEEDRDGWGHPYLMTIPKGQVLYIQQIIPGPVNGKEQWLLRVTIPGIGQRGLIAQYLIKDIGGLKAFLQRDMNVVLEAANEYGEIMFDAYGTDWSVVAWLGHPSKIPGLASRA